MTAKPVRLRPLNSVVTTASTWAVAAGGIGVVLALLIDAAADPPLYWGLVGGAAGLVFLLAAYRVRLEVDEREIRVFNVARTHHIAWDSVSRVGVARWWWSPSVLMVGVSAVAVWTTSGRRHVIDASVIEVPRVLDALAMFDPDINV